MTHRRSLRKSRLAVVARALGLAALSVTLVAEHGSAQLVGQAPYFRPVHDPSPTYFVSANFGGVESAAAVDLIGLRLSTEGDRFRWALGLARVGSDLEADDESESESEESDEGRSHLGIEASMAYSFLDQNTHFWLLGALLGVGTVALERGLGIEQVAWRQWDIPLGLTFGPNARTPLSFLSDFEPWVAARLHARRTAFADMALDDAWRVGVGLSIGLRVRLPSGLGAQTAFDWLQIRDPLSPMSAWEYSWSAGAHIGF